MCSFDITIDGSVDVFVNKARTEVNGAGESFNGNSSSGSFNVPIPFSQIAGSYTIIGQIATVTITSKPFVISCSAIEDYIEAHA